MTTFRSFIVTYVFFMIGWDPFEIGEGCTLSEHTDDRPVSEQKRLLLARYAHMWRESLE